MSNKLELDFIQHSPFALSNWNSLGLSLLLASLLVASLTIHLYQTRKNEQVVIFTKLNEINDQFQHKKLPVHLVSEVITPEKKLQIEATVSELIIPWGELLLAIEKSDTQDVALLGLEPSVKKHLVVLKGEAKNLQSVLNYVTRLEEQPVLEQVYLQKHNVDESNSAKPVSFTVLAQWHTAEE